MCGCVCYWLLCVVKKSRWRGLMRVLLDVLVGGGGGCVCLSVFVV